MVNLFLSVSFILALLNERLLSAQAYGLDMHPCIRVLMPQHTCVNNLFIFYQALDQNYIVHILSVRRMLIQTSTVDLELFMLVTISSFWENNGCWFNRFSEGYGLNYH